jgi:protein involved in polysaccharide export with SLBB domain
MRTGFIASFVFALGLCCSSRAAQDTNQSVFLQEIARMKESIRSMDSLDNRQKLGPGDRITYRVLEDQEEPKSLLITDSGDLEVPYLGLVHAAGKTCMDLAREIKGMLEKNLYFRATVMMSAEVINKTRATGKVYVTGQVRNSGGFDVPAGETITVSRAILNAGGFSDFSDKKNVQLTRKKDGRTETHTINVQEVLQKGKLDGDLVVQAGDIIFVPERNFKW